MDDLDKVPAAAHHMNDEWLKRLNEAGPDGWEFYPPAPGGTWVATGPGGDSIAAFSPADVLNDALEMDAERRRHDGQPGLWGKPLGWTCDAIAKRIEQFARDATKGEFSFTRREWRECGDPYIGDAAIDLAVEIAGEVSALVGSINPASS